MPKFSIIVSDYEKSVRRDGMVRGLMSISGQVRTFKDFELLIAHDGPKEVPYEKEFDFKGRELTSRTRFLERAERAGDAGQACRNEAMKQARGDWFLQFNIDNLLYGDCLRRLSSFIDGIKEKVVIFEIWHHNLEHELTGIPPSPGCIDLLQLVAHRDVWQGRQFGVGSRTPDGDMYEAICAEHPYAVLSERLGENF